MFRSLRRRTFLGVFAAAAALALPAAAGLFLPLFGWALSPVLAAGAMALSCLVLTANALRLLRYQP